MRRLAQRGFSLVELILALAIFSIISVVIARLFLSGYRSWLFSKAGLIAHQQTRAARDSIIKNTRQASAATLMIHQLDGSQPPWSMISFVDVSGNSLCYFQKGDQLIQGRWELAGSTRSVTGEDTVIPGKIRQVAFVYPDLHNMARIKFGIYMSWLPFKDAARPIDIYRVGDLEIKNP